MAKAQKKASTKTSKKTTKHAKPVKAASQAKATTMKTVKVPGFSIEGTGGLSVNLKETAGKKVVLYFYPKDMTPGCTIEGHEFSKLKGEFSKLNAVVYGVSRDTLASQEKFRAKENYTVDLLADTEEKLCNAFSVIKDKNMYGKKVRGIERSTFVLDQNGKVIKEWRGVKAEGHAAQVLDFLKSEK